MRLYNILTVIFVTLALGIRFFVAIAAPYRYFIGSQSFVSLRLCKQFVYLTLSFSVIGFLIV